MVLPRHHHYNQSALTRSLVVHSMLPNRTIKCGYTSNHQPTASLNRCKSRPAADRPAIQSAISVACRLYLSREKYRVAHCKTISQICWSRLLSSDANTNSKQFSLRLLLRRTADHPVSFAQAETSFCESLLRDY